MNKISQYLANLKNTFLTCHQRSKNVLQNLMKIYKFTTHVCQSRYFLVNVELQLEGTWSSQQKCKVQNALAYLMME